MRIIISSFICGLIFAATVTVYAAPTVKGEQVISETDMIAVAPPQDSVAKITELPAEALPTITKNDLMLQGVAPSQAIGTPSLSPETAKASTKEQPAIMQQNQQQPISPEVTNPGNVGVSGETNDLGAKNLIDRLTVLETQNTALNAQVTQLKERIGLVEERVIGHVGETKAKGCLCDKMDGLKKYMGAKLFLIGVGRIAIIILLLAGYMILSRRRESVAVNYPQDNLPQKDEDFNPMEGQEGVVAKLNLARTYIEMGKESKAQGILYDVLARGNDAEQKEAKELLEKIKHPNLDD